MYRWVVAASLLCAMHLGAQNISPPKPPEPPPEAAPAAAPTPDTTRPNADALKKERPKVKTPVDPKEEVPPEEDASLSTDNIQFNPLQAQKEITAGNYYYKKGNYRAASNRYKRAAAYDDSNSEAWLRLGESSEKVKDPQTEREAYTKFLAVAPDAKNAAEIRKKLDKLK
ncbi:MAG TPA: tetratricopeptide repeat protein [Candidatus Sulfopaludibacter sp.]|jgi:tetratricopeptide (TPR) repeat protein|nr:tetratricopeptide repeat protein [Candidatus Sulfopaludibacter sp.]